MHVTRSAEAPVYQAPGHHRMTTRRLQGHEAGPSSTLWLGLLRILPGGSTSANPSPCEKMYLVQEGELMVSNGDWSAVLQAGDSCRFAPNEIRRLENRSEEPATVVLAMALSG